MPLGLINGGPFRPFNRAISARCSTTVRSSSATLPNSPTTSSRSWADDRTSRSNGGLTQSLNLTSPRRGKEKVHDRPGFCPCYQGRKASPHLGGFVGRIGQAETRRWAATEKTTSHTASHCSSAYC